MDFRVTSRRRCDDEPCATVEPEGFREGEGESREKNTKLRYVFNLVFELHLYRTVLTVSGSRESRVEFGACESREHTLESTGSM